MRKKITVLTATRAEYGLLKNLIKALCQEKAVVVEVVVTGAHLSPEFGMTYGEIVKDGVQISKKIEILLSSDTPVGISKSMGLAMISFAEYFEESRPDAIIVLGDRYETLAVCCAAMNARVPIVHLYGGETTEGAVDEAIRHSITKMSYLHCTSTDEYRKRVIQLGEQPERVFQVGALGIENIMKMQLLSKDMLEAGIGFRLDKPYAVITFHPVTLENNMAGTEFMEVLKVVEKHKEMKFIFTKANADANGRVINKMIDGYVNRNENAAAFESLGILKYLSALKYSAMVIGNSSSGLVEAPSFHIPTINIGDRQKGRLAAASVIHCEAEEGSIDNAIAQALSADFMREAKDADNPYGDGKTSEKIVKIIMDNIVNAKVNLKKKFYDLPGEDGMGDSV